MDIKDTLKEAASTHAKAVRHAAAVQVAVAKDAAAAQARLVMSDLWHSVRTDRTAQLMILILIFSIVFGDNPEARIALYPFLMFNTMIHEAGHALMARLTGGHVSAIALNPTPDAYGMTWSSGGEPLLIVPGGYLASAIMGALLIWWGRNPKEARFVLQSVGTAMLAVTLFYGSGTIVSFVTMLAISAVIFVIARKASDRFCHLFLIFLAVQTSLEAMVNMKDMILASAIMGGVGDSKRMEELTGIPTLLWTAAFAGFALAAYVFAFWLAYRAPHPKVPLPDASAALGANDQPAAAARGANDQPAAPAPAANEQLAVPASGANEQPAAAAGDIDHEVADSDSAQPSADQATAVSNNSAAAEH